MHCKSLMSELLELICDQETGTNRIATDNKTNEW